MTREDIFERSVYAALVVVALALYLTGCGGNAPPIDPGSLPKLTLPGEDGTCPAGWALVTLPPVEGLPLRAICVKDESPEPANEPGDCRGADDNEPPPEAPRCSDEPSQDPTKWSDCWSCNGRSGGVWRYIPPKEPEGPPDAEATPDPDPTPAPTPQPPPRPTPEPTPAPTPAPPDLSGCYAGPWVWHYRTCRPEREAAGECVPEEPPSDRLGAHVRDAAGRALERGLAEGWIRPEGPNPHSGAPRGAVAEADLARWAGLVAEELRAAGWCGYAGPPHAQEEVRLCAPGEPVCEVHDTAIGGAPGGREWVGPDERHMPTIGYPREGAPGPGPAPTPEPAATTCTVPGIGDPEGSGLKRFPSRRAACAEFLGVSERGGHLRRHGDWWEDLGSGGGWYDLDCRRYDSRAGRLLHENWFNIRCEP